MRRSVGLLLVALLMATSAAGCGDAGGEDGGTAAAPAAARTQATTRAEPSAERVDDVTLAKRALATLDDVPDGWRQDGGTVTRLRCGSYDPFRGASAVVRSKRLRHDHTGVQERIAVYATPAAAAGGLRRLDSRIAARCLQQEVRRRVSQEAGAPASPAELVRVDRLGPAATASRYVSTSVSSYGKVVGYIDAVHMRVGRAIAALVFVEGPSPPDEAVYEDVVERVSRRLQTTLG